MPDPVCGTNSGGTLTFLLESGESRGHHLGGLGGLVPDVCHCWDKHGDTWAFGGSSSTTHSP